MIKRHYSVVLVALIASGSLAGACRDGQVTAPQRISHGEPKPNQLDIDEPKSRVTGVPYVHVTPADVGVSIGPGVIATYPTITYSGSCKITKPGTTIEDRIINCSSLNIQANDVTIRNSVLNLTGPGWGMKMGVGGGSTATGFTLEYSHLNYQNDGKVIIAYNGSGNGDYRNMTVRNNNIEGGHDFFYIEGRFDGFLVENNVMGPLGCADGSDPHADGFQMGELAPISGKMTIRGNYFDPKKLCTKAAILFSTGSDSTNTTDILFENNRLTTWGANTIWCANSDSCTVRYNVYDSVWEAQAGNRCGGGECIGGGGPACCGYPSRAVNFGSGTSGSYSCNRYESDGGFIEQHYVSGVTHSTSGCPSY